MSHFTSACLKTLLPLCVAATLHIGAVNAADLDRSDIVFVYDLLGYKTGASTWKPEKFTQRRLTLQGRLFDITIAVHHDVAATWTKHQTAQRFINNVTEMFELIYQTERGKILLDRFRDTGYQLRIFDIGSEPFAGEVLVNEENLEGYRASSPSSKRDEGFRASLRNDSLAGPGTSSNIGLKKEVVFGFSSNRGEALRLITEELVHAGRASWGVEVPLIKGLLDYKVFPQLLANDSLTLPYVIEELEVAGEFPFRSSNTQLVPSYIPILTEMKQRHPDLRFPDVGSYLGKKGPGWLDSIRFVDRFFRYRLRDQISSGDKATMLAALNQIEQWAHSVAEATRDNPRFVNAVNRLLGRIEFTKRTVHRICS